ncbi:metallopeptidase [Capnocytophaga canis]|uniref:metallopeptidase n=1 Tax=Capnocytophaga canis TaxID=1848903 RepID=UPI00370DB063
MKNPHEVMYILELPHTFPETFEKDKNKKHIFKKGATHNYMDYNNTKKHTQKWQKE